MPIYEYQCRECGNVFEELQSMSDQSLCRCPSCDGPVKRLISKSVGLVFKGSGFYVNDYRSAPGDSSSSSKCGSCSTSNCSTCGSSGNGAKKGKTDSTTKAG